MAGATATGMSKVAFGTAHDSAIDAHANAAAAVMKRGSANIEDQLRSALAVIGGLEVTDASGAEALKDAVDAQLTLFLESLLQTERGIAAATGEEARQSALSALQSFLLSFVLHADAIEFLKVLRAHLRPAAQAAHRLGRRRAAQGAHRAPLPRQHQGRRPNDLAARVRTRSQPRRVPLGLAQAPCAGQLLPRTLQELKTTARAKLKSGQRRRSIITACWKQGSREAGKQAELW
jgi:hypothetical protein